MMKLKKSQYFKLWLQEKQIPFLVFPLVIISLIGVLILVIGGTAAGWNIGKALTSKTAMLFYMILVIVSTVAIFDWLSKKNKR